MPGPLGTMQPDLEHGSNDKNATVTTGPVQEQLLRQQIKAIGGHEVEGVAVLSFRALQLYRLAALQAELIEKQNAVIGHGAEGRGEEGARIDALLQSYGKYQLPTYSGS